MVIAQRRRIVEEVDISPDQDEVDEQELVARLRNPSANAIAKFEDCSRSSIIG
jgi:hypothetical protein